MKKLFGVARMARGIARAGGNALVACAGTLALMSGGFVSEARADRDIVLTIADCDDEYYRVTLNIVNQLPDAMRVLEQERLCQTYYTCAHTRGYSSDRMNKLCFPPGETPLYPADPDAPYVDQWLYQALPQIYGYR